MAASWLGAHLGILPLPLSRTRLALIGVLLYNTRPLFSPLLARALLGITFGIRTVVSLALGFAGVVLVLNFRRTLGWLRLCRPRLRIL
jgi:drug/metabolite transporter (DMT)-like permease